MKSIIQTEKVCYFANDKCDGWLEEHHIFGGANRKNSEKYGLKVHLCKRHHDKAHEGGILMDTLHKVGQRKFEETHSHEEFMKIFGKNYL